jgi:hypothetical protein
VEVGGQRQSYRIPGFTEEVPAQEVSFVVCIDSGLQAPGSTTTSLGGKPPPPLRTLADYSAFANTDCYGTALPAVKGKLFGTVEQCKAKCTETDCPAFVHFPEGSGPPAAGTPASANDTLPFCRFKGGTLKEKRSPSTKRRPGVCFLPKPLGSGEPPPPPAQHGDASISFVVAESGAHHGVAPDMVWEMGHALASELGEGPSVRESFVDTPERVLVPPQFSRGTCESCLPVILDLVPMGMTSTSRPAVGALSSRRSVGSRLCGPGSRLGKACQDVCDHYEQYAAADIYADESVSSHISYRRGEGYLRSHGAQGIALACFALVHPDAYSAGKADALATPR